MIAGRGRGDIFAKEDIVGYKETRKREREREKERESKMREKLRGIWSERERKVK